MPEMVTCHQHLHISRRCRGAFHTMQGVGRINGMCSGIQQTGNTSFTEKLVCAYKIYPRNYFNKFLFPTPFTWKSYGSGRHMHCLLFYGNSDVYILLPVQVKTALCSTSNISLQL